MTSRARQPDERQWNDVLDEIEWNVAQLRKHGPEAMARKGLRAGGDGCPRSSLPESSIASGRGGDPTGQTVVMLAGGKEARWRPPEVGGYQPATPDTWEGIRDEVAAAVRNMQRQTNDAVVRLREALGSMHKALPPKTVADPSREQCQSCGTARQIATKYGNYPAGWVSSTAQCNSCYKRSMRQVAAR